MAHKPGALSQVGALRGRARGRIATVWTRREAVVKATGEELRADLGEVVVAGSGPRLTATAGDGRTAEVVMLHPGPAYRAYLAILGPGPHAVREEDGTALLR